MNSKLIASMAIASVAATEITYDESLKCGKCIKGGFIYCLPADTADGEVVADGDDAPTGTCVEEATDGMVCSDTYSDVDYAKGFCPQKQSQCGSNQEIEFDDVTAEGEEEEITIEGLTDGETCTYTVKSSKGSPAFRMKDDSTISDEAIEITYIEFEGERAEIGEEGEGSEASPRSGMP